MERLTDADPDNRVPTWRAQLHALGEQDTDLNDRIDADGYPTSDGTGEPIDRANREHVAYYEDSQGRWKPTRLKRGDHVLCAGLWLVVIGPARDRRYFMGYYAAWFANVVIGPIEAAFVTDRAPEDSGETPMPIIPEAA